MVVSFFFFYFFVLKDKKQLGMQAGVNVIAMVYVKAYSSVPCKVVVNVNRRWQLQTQYSVLWLTFL